MAGKVNQARLSPEKVFEAKRKEIIEALKKTISLHYVDELEKIAKAIAKLQLGYVYRVRAEGIDDLVQKGWDPSDLQISYVYIESENIIEAVFRTPSDLRVEIHVFLMWDEDIPKKQYEKLREEMKEVEKEIRAKLLDEALKEIKRLREIIDELNEELEECGCVEEDEEDGDH